MKCEQCDTELNDKTATIEGDFCDHDGSVEVQTICDNCGSFFNAFLGKSDMVFVEKEKEEKMPGPVSDSFNPEFGTGANRDLVADAIRHQVKKINKILGPQLKNIVSVCEGKSGQAITVILTEKELRVIRFALNYTLDVI